MRNASTRRFRLPACLSYVIVRCGACQAGSGSVRMAMVLAQDTPIVLLDEPTSFMDVAACFDMVRLIRQVRQRGKTVVAVIHDLNLALSVADQVFAMERGRLAAQGEPTDGRVRSAIEQSFGVRLEHVQTSFGTAWVPFESRE